VEGLLLKHKNIDEDLCNLLGLDLDNILEFTFSDAWRNNLFI
jgi:hypothetical protein